MMVEFDARIEELQKYCKEAIGSQTAARFKTIRTMIGYELNES
jgi:hypothetical protein